MEVIIPTADELEQLRQTTRRFMREEVRPAEDKVPHDAYELPADLLEPLRKKAKHIGLWAVRSPAEYGGGGLGLEASTVFSEEAARCKMGAYIPACGATGSNVPAPILLGIREQIEKFAVPAIRDGAKNFIAISEPSGGSDPARSIRTRAVRKGDRYIINGSKLWISGAKSAKWGLVFSRTGDRGDRAGITCFIVDGKPKGMTMREVPVIRAWPTYEITFENVEIPVEHRLGEEGQGFALCERWLVENRVPYAAGCIGIAQ